MKAKLWLLAIFAAAFMVNLASQPAAVVMASISAAGLYVVGRYWRW